MKRILKKSLLFLPLLIFLLWGCNATRFVEPLEKGKHAVGINAGGPLIEFGGTIIPTPMSGICYGYGVDSNLTVFGGLHTTSLLFSNLQVDLGATYQLLPQQGAIPNFSITPHLNVIAHFGESDTKLWPAVDLNTFWNYGEKRSYFYLGMSNWYEPAASRAHGESTLRRFIWNPQLGHVWKFGKGYQFTTEMKFLAPDEINTYLFVPYRSVLGQRGATGVFLNIVKTF